MEPVSRDAVEAVAHGIASASAVDHQCLSVVGVALGKVFDVNVSGDLSVAARRVGKMLRIVRTSACFRDLEVKLPDGSRSVKIFIDNDKNRKMVRTEILTKKLGGILRSACPGHDVRVKKFDGIVEVDQYPLARVLVESASVYRVEWNLDKILALELDRDDVGRLLTNAASSSGAVANVSWG